MAKDLPPELARVLTDLDDVVAPIRTRLARLRETQRPENEPPDPDAVRRAAEAEDAPPELKAVAEAVADGRTSWEKVVAGEADDLPEVRAVYSAMRRRLAEAREERSEPGDDDDFDGPVVHVPAW